MRKRRDAYKTNSKRRVILCVRKHKEEEIKL